MGRSSVGVRWIYVKGCRTVYCGANKLDISISVFIWREHISVRTFMVVRRLYINAWKTQKNSKTK